MSYPVKILPNPNFKYIDCDCSSLYLVRSTTANTEADLIDPETKKVYIKHICSPKDNIIDLSTSLLGVFETEHLKLELTSHGLDKYNHECSPDEKVAIPILDEDYTQGKFKICFFLKIGDINKNFVDFRKENMTHKAECNIIHSPMRWNYWHFSVRWKVGEDIIPYENEYRKKNWVQKLSSESRSMISEFGVINVNEANIIPEKCYMKKLPEIF